MKITLENGKTIEISRESYQALLDAVKEPVWEDVVNKRMFDPRNMFEGWRYEYRWLNDETMHKDWKIFLHMMLWQKTYDAGFVPDWEDENQNKWYTWYDEEYKEYRLYATGHNRDIMNVWFSSREKVESCLKDLKRIGVI